jgi:prepilin-type N-terminal cleavage/methylation domain-containing protein
MNRSRLRHGHSRGFTLIELSVVVVVIALLLGSLLLPLNAQVQQRNASETQRRLEEAREALIGFAMINGRLPRPAVSDADGTERAATCATNAECTGYLPWAVLGTPRSDAWGKLIRYSVTPALANAAIGMGASGNKYVKTRQAGTIVIVANDAAAVLISHGANNWGRTLDATNVPDNSATNIDEDANATNDGQSGTPFWSRPQADNNGSSGGEFDDQVIILSQPVLVSRLIAAGKLP